MPPNPNKLSQFWQELKRRKVIRVIVIYAATGFAIIEFVDIVTDPLSLPEWALALVILIVAIGFPIAVIFAWIFDVTAKGIKKTGPFETDNIGKEFHETLENQSTPKNSIIVLPFENMSSDPEQEYFSDGITEEIITDLSHIHDLMVISRSSAMTFKGKKCNIKEIAEKVNVRYVLEGSVRKAGSDLRITAQLIDGLTDIHLWSNKYNGTLDDIFDIQEKVSKSIVDALNIKLTSIERNSLAKQKLNDSTAYEQYLLARHETWSGKKESISHAIQLLNGSMNAIGRNEYLLISLAFAYFQYVNLGIDPDIKHLDLANELLNEALVLNPVLSKAYYIKSLIHETRGELSNAFISIKQALNYDPADSEALMMMAFLYAMVGRPEKGKPYAKLAIESDPLNPIAYYGEWWVNQSAGEYAKTVEVCSNIYNLDKDNIVSAWSYAISLAYDNKVNEAIEIFDSIIEKYPDQFLTKMVKAQKYALNNDKQKVLESISEELENTAKEEHTFAWTLADVYSLIGEKDKAIDYLERATKDIFIDYPFFAEHDPFLENIRNEERFKKLMVEVKTKWENFNI